MVVGRGIHSQPRKLESHGFTIVELLVVIVVIAILAAITVIAYTGVSQKAVASSLQSDLSNAATQLKMFQVENSAYPVSITDCPTPAAGNICAKSSTGNTLGYTVNNQSSPKSFLLLAVNGNQVYKVTNNTAPAQVANTMQSNVTPGAIVELHAAKANAGTGPGINSPLTTTWTDTSGIGNNGTLTNFTGQTPWTGAGTTGDPYRLVFDGVNDGVSLPALHAIDDGSVTYEGWFIVPTSVGYYRLFSEQGSSVQADVMVVGDANPDPTIRGRVVGSITRNDGVTNYAWSSAVLLADGALHHVALTVGNGIAYMYVDGQAGSVKNLTSASIVTTATAVGRSALGGNNLSGSTLVARIYPFALSAAQVAANYAAGPTW